MVVGSNRRTQLGMTALDYLRLCLSAGQTLIARQLDLPLDRGSVWAFLPDELPTGVELNPEHSLSTSIPDYRGKTDADVRLSDFISEYLRGAGTYAVFQNVLVSPGDPWLSRQDHFFTYGPEIYHYLDSGDSDSGLMLDVLRRGYAANSRLNSGVLVCAPEMPEIMPEQVITRDMIDMLAAGVDHIIVEAFDGDREIIWSKHSSS